MTSDSKRSIGQQIRKARKNCGYTQEFVAEKLGVGPSHISNMERGVRGITTERLVMLAELFGKNSDYFLTGVQTSNQTSDSVIKKIQSFPEWKHRLAEVYIDMLDGLDDEFEHVLYAKDIK
ncbi:MAG: helix-turn-helix domain-containing protein [Wujia sp.]